MSKDARCSEPLFPLPQTEQVLWITGCVVGAAHSPARPSDEALAWYLLETTGEHNDIPAGRLGHR